MKCIAPGKLLLTGAYGVLDGGPAIVVAVNRYAVADAETRTTELSREVREVFDGEAPSANADALMLDGKKMGLGSSAAVLVATMGAHEASLGRNIDDSEVRSRIFLRAREAHRVAQGGGSGVDVAASTYGGVLKFSLSGGRPWIAALTFPESLEMHVFYSGESARTSDLLASVTDFRNTQPEKHAAVMQRLIDRASDACEFFMGGSVREIVESAALFSESLLELGEEADAPIVPESFARLNVTARSEGGVFMPSGAGGGDIGVYLGVRPPSPKFSERAVELGMTSVPLEVDVRGMRLLSEN